MPEPTLLRLPALPPAIKILKTDESQSLNLRYPQSVTTVAKCLTCDGRKTFLWYDDAGAVATYECPCSDQYQLSRWLWNSGILLKYQRLGWRDFERLPDEVAVAATDYLDHLDGAVRGGLGIILSGPRGTGKTLLAHLILKQMVASGVDVYATSFSHMIDAFADGWRDKAQSQWFNHRIRDASVLYIDDVGRERNKGAGSVGDNMLETVLRHRVGCQQPTLISSNIDSDKIGDAYGGWTDSLLSECSVRLHVPGSDVRSTMGDRLRKEMRSGISRPVVLA